jgi:hypothetical protein
VRHSDTICPKNLAGVSGVSSRLNLAKADPRLRRIGGIRASLRDAGRCNNGPGDKSPGYCHMSLRDEEPSQTPLILVPFTCDPKWVQEVSADVGETRTARQSHCQIELLPQHLQDELNPGLTSQGQTPQNWASH